MRPRLGTGLVAVVLVAVFSVSAFAPSANAPTREAGGDDTPLSASPFIVSTFPADGSVGVPLTAPVVAVFNETMSPPSVVATFTPPVGGLTYTWTSGDTVLTLMHATPFANCTVYRVEVTGKDVAGNPLVPGPVPNPWSFATQCAGPPPPFDHFLCYRATLANSSQFVPVNVNLTDQFGNVFSVVLGPRQLCTPVSKNGEPVPDKVTHLACYVTQDIGSSFAARDVVITNQFENSTWLVEFPRSLCVPAEKNGEQPVDLGFNHFRCYQANDSTPFPPRTVTLVDQFGGGSAIVFPQTQPARNFLATLCNPVSKNGAPVRDPAYHLACYDIDPLFTFQPRQVRVRDQFGLWAWNLTVPETLCVPSAKVVPPPPGVEHFKCYDAAMPKGVPFPVRIVTLKDQFELIAAKVRTPTQLCNPVSKNGEAVRDPFTHLVCYALQPVNWPPFAPINVTITNQFGKQNWTVVNRDGLCVPSTKNREGPINPNVDHYKCYKATYQAGTVPPKIGLVRLDDQFEKRVVRVQNPDVLCNPVSKNNEPIPNPEAHLACYKILELPFPSIFPIALPRFMPRTVYVENQFQKSNLIALRPATLCVPSTKGVPPPPPPPPPAADHYKCYDAQLENGTFVPRTVTIVDQFGNFTALVSAPGHLCNPTSKDGGPVPDPATHLACYETKDVGGDVFTPRVVKLSNQYGNLTWTILSPAGLCNPAEKNGEPGVDFASNHYRCYVAVTTNGTAPFTPRTVQMRDQFGNWTGVAERPLLLCNPASKDGSGIRSPATHLACFLVDQLPPFGVSVRVRDQFGTATWKLTQNNLSILCVPSEKTVVP